MPNSYKEPKTINKVSPFSLPQKQKQACFKCLDLLVMYQRKIVDDIFPGYKGKPLFNKDVLENYLSGFNFKYHGFSKNELGFNIDGFYDYDPKTNTVWVYYDRNDCPERQLFTIIHELFHFCQKIDPSF